MPVRTLIRSSAPLLACCLSLLPQRATAQSTTSLLPDADLLDSRTVRIRMLTAWTRFDELLGTGGQRNIAWSLATDSLGVRQVPTFAPTETAIQAASGLSGFRLTAGNIVTAGDSRVFTMPLVIEYGLAKRLNIGIVVPLVETRTTLYEQLNPTLGHANVGPNPAVLNSAVLAQNAALVRSVRLASDTLQRRLTDCQAVPTGPGCAALLPQQAAAQALIQSSGALATALEQLYGTDAVAHPGQPYVPLKGDLAQTAVNTRIQNVRDGYRTLLGTDPVTGQIVPAAGPGARADLQKIFATFGRDSLQSTDRSSVGDISIGASYQFVNTFPDTVGPTTGFRHIRLAGNATYRIGTGEPANPNRVFDVPTGYGQPGIIGALAADVQFTRRFSATAVGSYTAQLGSVSIPLVPNAENAVLPLTSPTAGTRSAGNVLQVSLVPRYRLAGNFAFSGQYSLLQTAADRYTVTVAGTTPVPGSATPVNFPPIAPYGIANSTVQQIGFGFLYSSIVTSARAPGTIPFEMSFSHLETIAGNGGPVEKTFRDQIELKVYWRP